MALSKKQDAFALCFDGHGTASAIKAGYPEKTAAATASRLLKNVKVLQAIQKRQDKELKQGIRPHIATRLDRQAFWTEVMNDKDQEMKNRLKASELLGKSEADFTEKIQATGDIHIETAPTIDLSTLAPEQLYDMTRLLYGGGCDHAEERTTGTDEN